MPHIRVLNKTIILKESSAVSTEGLEFWLSPAVT